MTDPVFADRRDAGRRLGAALAERLGEDALKDAVVLGIPRGGVVVAVEAARVVGVPCGVAVVRKLGSPANPEYALGAIAPGGVRVIHADAVAETATRAGDLARVERAEHVELERRVARFERDGMAGLVRGRIGVVVDDGIATGATATAACLAVRAGGAARVLLAVPVAPASWHPDSGVADDYLALITPARFRAVGEFYADFTQTADDEVDRLLAAASD